MKVAGKAKFGVEVFQQEKRDLGVGDTILWNRTLSREKLNNGQLVASFNLYKTTINQQDTGMLVAAKKIKCQAHLDVF